MAIAIACTHTSMIHVLKPQRISLALATSFLFLSLASGQTTLFVDADLATGADDGSSWADAFRGTLALQVALASTNGGELVFVAEGRYLPSAQGGRDASFELKDGVRLYGGFRGGEADPDERPSLGEAPTVLSGDLAGNDNGIANTGENSFHVVRAMSSTVAALLDGVEVSGGNTNGSPVWHGGGLLIQNNRKFEVRNCRFVRNRAFQTGGALYATFAELRVSDTYFASNVAGFRGGAVQVGAMSNSSIDRCTFTENQAEDGGALRISANISLLLANSLFYRNTATGNSGKGGAILVESGLGARILGCTFVANVAAGGVGGAMNSFNSRPPVTNCIFWANESPFGPLDYRSQIDSLSDVSYSIVQGSNVSGSGLLNVDPEFADQVAGNFQLLPSSPAIDAANGSALPAEFVSDLARSRRRYDFPGVMNTGTGAPVDMGCYELSGQLGTIFCQTSMNSTGSPGLLDAVGSTAVADNDLTLTAGQLPANTFGFFLVSPWRTEGTFPPGSAGRLCLGGAIGRVAGPGQILNSGAAGSFSLTIDLTQLPRPTTTVAVLPGDTWAFQAWHRDAFAGLVISNLTNGVRIPFE